MKTEIIKPSLLRIILLISLMCCIYTAGAVSELTLRITDLVSVISARVNAHSISGPDKKELLRTLDSLEQELRNDKENSSTNQLFQDTHYSEMHLLLDITRTFLDGQVISDNKQNMLIQQAELIIKKNKEMDFSGEDFIRSFYLFAKTISVDETFLQLSITGKVKLPRYAFNHWWNEKVRSVAVKNVDHLGQNQYKVWLLYELTEGSKQCSVDWLQLIREDDNWLIDDFLWSQTSVTHCEKL